MATVDYSDSECVALQCRCYDFLEDPPRENGETCIKDTLYNAHESPPRKGIDLFLSSNRQRQHYMQYSAVQYSTSTVCQA